MLVSVYVILTFLSTPSARRATEGDNAKVKQWTDFYPRPPRGGRRSSGRERSAAPNFYPRPPRGGRPRGKLRACGRGDFYPRPPRGGRLIRRFSSALSNNFYPRPPRGGRHPLWTIPNLYTKFLSTPSARRATCIVVLCMVRHRYISIHALREEGDTRQSIIFCGSLTFLSTPSARRATQLTDLLPKSVAISIHALREEGDCMPT